MKKGVGVKFLWEIRDRGLCAPKLLIHAVDFFMQFCDTSAVFDGTVCDITKRSYMYLGLKFAILEKIGE